MSCTSVPPCGGRYGKALHIMKGKVITMIKEMIVKIVNKQDLTYEEAYNGLIDLEFRQLFQETFRLARAIYR